MVRIASLTALTAFAATALVFGSPAAHAGSVGDADLVVYDGGLAQITFVGLLQTQVTPYVGDDALIANGDPAEDAGARLRRARVGFAGSAYGNVDFELTVQATADGIDLLDAWVGHRILSSLFIAGGARKVPYSRFAMAGGGKSVLIDRPLAVRAMAPFRQVGLTLEGDVGNGLLGWAAGVYNGFVRNANFHQGYGESKAIQGNQFTNFAYVLRVNLSPFSPMGSSLADLDKGDFRAALGGGFYYDDGETLSTLAFEVDALIKVSGLHIALEFLWDEAEPSDTPTGTQPLPTTVTRMAAIGEVGYVILAEQLGLTVRAEFIDDNTEVDNNGDQLIVTGGLQYYFKRHHLKAGVEYTHRTELNGVSLDNDSVLAQMQFEL